MGKRNLFFFFIIITAHVVVVVVIFNSCHRHSAHTQDPDISYDCNQSWERSDNGVHEHRTMHTIANQSRRTVTGYHGTRCAGEIAMIANNGKCGVGIAYNARIGGIRLLGGKIYDVMEGMALGYAHDRVDIYSSSWGPSDDGMALERPGRMAAMAMERGITYGRNGHGAIYIWANGNGGGRGDDCNCDG